ncbi:unnamed protein product, partial [Amoebophrya sp. A25]
VTGAWFDLDGGTVASPGIISSSPPSWSSLALGSTASPSSSASSYLSRTAVSPGGGGESPLTFSDSSGTSSPQTRTASAVPSNTPPAVQHRLFLPSSNAGQDQDGGGRRARHDSTRTLAHPILSTLRNTRSPATPGETARARAEQRNRALNLFIQQQNQRRREIRNLHAYREIRNLHAYNRRLSSFPETREIPEETDSENLRPLREEQARGLGPHGASTLVSNTNTQNYQTRDREVLGGRTGARSSIWAHSYAHPASSSTTLTTRGIFHGAIIAATRSRLLDDPLSRTRTIVPVDDSTPEEVSVSPSVGAGRPVADGTGPRTTTAASKFDEDALQGALLDLLEALERCFLGYKEDNFSTLQPDHVVPSLREARRAREPKPSCTLREPLRLPPDFYHLEDSCVGEGEQEQIQDAESTSSRRAKLWCSVPLCRNDLEARDEQEEQRSGAEGSEMYASCSCDLERDLNCFEDGQELEHPPKEDVGNKQEDAQHDVFLVDESGGAASGSAAASTSSKKERTSLTGPAEASARKHLLYQFSQCKHVICPCHGDGAANFFTRSVLERVACALGEEFVLDLKRQGQEQSSRKTMTVAEDDSKVMQELAQTLEGMSLQEKRDRMISRVTSGQEEEGGAGTTGVTISDDYENSSSSSAGAATGVQQAALERLEQMLDDDDILRSCLRVVMNGGSSLLGGLQDEDEQRHGT